MQRLTLIVVHCFFEFRNALNLVLHAGVADDALLSFELLKEFLNVARSTGQNLLCAFEDFDFGLELFESLLALFMLRVFLFEVGGVLAEVVAFEELAPLDLLVVVFALGQLLFKVHLLFLESLYLVLLLVLLLLRSLCLAAVNRQLVVRLLWLDFALQYLAFACQTVLVRCQSLQLSLRGLWLLEDHLDALQTIFLVGELPAEDVV